MDFQQKRSASEISGRGVGMNVVKEALLKLRGDISVVSHEGFGSRFVIRLPLSLAVFNGFVIRVLDPAFCHTEFRDFYHYSKRQTRQS